MGHQHQRRMYISATDLRHSSSNSNGQWSARSSTSGRESTSGSILKKRQDGNGRLETSSSCSSSTVVGSIPDKYRPAVGRTTSGESHKSRVPSQRMYSDSSTSSSQNSRRVGFKNNVAVYRFDSDGEDSTGYSSTVSETSEQLGAHSRRQKLQTRQKHSPPSHVSNTSPSAHDQRPLPPTTHDAAASWAAARGWSTTADRVGSPRHGADVQQDRQQLVADNVTSPSRLRSNSVGSGRPQFATISRTLYVDDDDDERRRNGSVCGRTSNYDHPTRENRTRSQQKMPVAFHEDCVLSCGSVAIHNPLFIDRAHYEYIKAEKGFTKRLVLTCSLKHVNHFNPDGLVVKANRTGTRARVVFNADTDSQQHDEPIDQLLLPYIVDPYCLTAQLQGDNLLVIEAPILH